MLYELLDIKKGITSVIGGGGKTTLLHVLADELKTLSGVIITTTTHIMKSDVFHTYVTTGENDLQNIKELLLKHRVLCVGSVHDGDKLGAPDVDICAFANLCDYVLVEADGSKHLPIKAHDDFEPVIPQHSTQTILVLGIDAIGQRVRDCVHRPHIMCKIAGCKERDKLTLQHVVKLLNTESLHNTVVVNKCDSDKLKDLADKLSDMIDEKTVTASLLKGEWYVSSN